LGAARCVRVVPRASRALPSPWAVCARVACVCLGSVAGMRACVTGLYVQLSAVHGNVTGVTWCGVDTDYVHMM
jgi:hypothetical protein